MPAPRHYLCWYSRAKLKICQKFKSWNFTNLYITLVETLPRHRSMHEVLGVSLLCTFRGDFVLKFFLTHGSLLTKTKTNCNKRPMSLDVLLENQLGHWPKCQKSQIYSLSTTGGRNWAYFCCTGSGFLDMGRSSKLAYVNMKLGHLSKFQKLCIYPLSTPRGQNELVLALRAALSEIWADFLLQRVEIELIFTLWAAVSEIE